MFILVNGFNVPKDIGVAIKASNVQHSALPGIVLERDGIGYQRRDIYSSCWTHLYLANTEAWSNCKHGSQSTVGKWICNWCDYTVDPYTDSRDVARAGTISLVDAS